MNVTIDKSDVFFEDKTFAFKIESFNVESNGLYFFEGTNGSGKTTLFNHLRKTLKSSLYLDQNYHRLIFDYKPIWWNICLQEVIQSGTKNGQFDKAVKLMMEFELDYLKAKETANKLSGGEKHILVLLRCFATDKKILLLDEPETGLDNEKREIFWKVLKKASNEKTIFITSHQVPKEHSKKKLKNLNTLNSKEIILYKLNL